MHRTYQTAASVERQVEYTFIYKQPVYEQLAPLGWQIAKQLSGRLNSYSLSNKKKLQIQEKWSFSFVIKGK